VVDRHHRATTAVGDEFTYVYEDVHRSTQRVAVLGADSKRSHGMTDAGAIARRYIELVGAHELAPLDEMISDSVVATTGSGTFGKAEWIGALQRLLPTLVRNDIREVVVDGSTACVVYDFVTSTDAGNVRCAEWISIDEDRRMIAINLLFDKTNWAAVAAAREERSN
jgi:hypothetical protein